jgi:uroporphyrinogen-III synthase
MAKVLLTRPLQRLSTDNTFSDMLRAEGIEVIELPMIRVKFPSDTEELDNALVRLAKHEFDYAILSSPTAAEFFHERVSDLDLSTSIRSGVGFGTIGEKSARKLEDYGYKIALPLPSQGAGAAALLVKLRTLNLSGKKALLLQSQIGIKVLERAFEMVGAETERVTLYETVGPSLKDAARLLQLLESVDGERPDVIAFFSPSSAEYFVRTLQEMGSGHLYTLPVLAAIGETTAFEIGMRLKRKPEIVARKANQESLAADIIDFLKNT